MSKSANIAIRTTPEIKASLENKARSAGFSTLTEYVLFVAQNAEIKVSISKTQKRE